MAPNGQFQPYVSLPPWAHEPKTRRERVSALYFATAKRIRATYRHLLDRDALLVEAKKQLAAATELHNANRLATVGRLTAGMAHEFGTPLGVVLARAQLILSADAGPEEIRADAEAIVEQVKRMTQMCREVLDYARPQAPVLVATDLGEVVRHMLVLLSPEARKRNVRLSFQGGALPLLVLANESKLMQILTNLIINAVQAMPRPGTVVLRVEQLQARPAGLREGSQRSYACVQVTDTGTGIGDADLPHIFETFFTTKKEGEGTGLGLAVSSRIAQEHNGWIGVTTEPGRGSCFTVYLPLIDTAGSVQSSTRP
jgi:signal transduction histidine kinase